MHYGSTRNGSPFSSKTGLSVFRAVRSGAFRWAVVDPVEMISKGGVSGCDNPLTPLKAGLINSFDIM